MAPSIPLHRPVSDYLAPAGATLRADHSIDEALAELRASQPPAQTQSQVLYFYVVNAQDQLVGVLPSRQLILAPGGTNVGDLMVRDIITLHAHETVFDALELFAMHRLLAIPVVDKDRKLLGIVELSLYTEEVFDLAHNRQLNEIFQLIGIHLEQSRQGSAFAGFRIRMPWLLANITGGLICAALGALFEHAVQQVVLFALFIPLILTLAESISVQSMTLAIEQAMARKRFPGQLRQEAATALMLGVCSGLIVGTVSLFWRGPLAATLTIGASVAGAMLMAALLGRLVPKFIHLLKLNPRIASGPITLAIVDIVTITLYLSTATLVLAW